VTLDTVKLLSPLSHEPGMLVAFLDSQFHTTNASNSVPSSNEAVISYLQPFLVTIHNIYSSHVSGSKKSALFIQRAV